MGENDALKASFLLQNQRIFKTTLKDITIWQINKKNMNIEIIFL